MLSPMLHRFTVTFLHKQGGGLPDKKFVYTRRGYTLFVTMLGLFRKHEHADVVVIERVRA